MNINEFITENITNFKEEMKNSSECGRIISVQNDIIEIIGLNNCFLNEMIEIYDINQLNLQKRYAIVISMHEHTVTAICLSRYEISIDNTIVKRCNTLINIDVSNDMIGHIFNGYANPIENIELINTKTIEVNLKPPTILNIKNNNIQIITGMPIIDIFIPLAYGQRQALIGDSGTGKTTILTNIMQSVKFRKKTICIYVSIGQNITNTRNIQTKLRKNECNNFIIINALASSGSFEKYFAPYTALTIAEYFKEQDYDVIVFIDDMNSHALAYQDIMLRIKQPTGKEGWPADIFYQHALILSMGHISKNHGSITIIPVITSIEEDITDYLITNIMSITDGQIVLSDKLAQMNKYPAININKSVSRIGRSIQHPDYKKLCTNTVNIVLKYNNLQELAILTNDKFLDEESINILSVGNIINEFLYSNKLYSFLYQLTFLHLILNQKIITINHDYLTIACNNNEININEQDVCARILAEYSTLIGI